MKIKIFSPIYGVPITFLEKYCPEQFDLVAFRKGEDGKDLVFTRDEERKFNGDEKTWGQDNFLFQSFMRKEKLEEPIELAHKSLTKTAGVFNAGREVEVNGEQIYKRIIIRKNIFAKNT